MQFTINAVSLEMHLKLYAIPGGIETLNKLSGLPIWISKIFLNVNDDSLRSTKTNFNFPIGTVIF